MTTAFVVFIGVVTGVCGYASMTRLDWISGFMFGITCCLAVGSVWLADAMIKNRRAIDRNNAQLEILKELKS